jgi:hypothetical protein
VGGGGGSANMNSFFTGGRIRTLSGSTQDLAAL